MLNNRIVSGIITTTLLLTPTNTVAYANNTVEKVTFNKINNDNTPKIYEESYYKLKEEFKTKQNIINRVNERFDKIEEKKRKEEEEKERIEKENSYNIVFTITHYGLSSEENGGFVGLNCQNNPLRSGMVANNTLPLGTIIEFENGERVIVADRGGSDFNNSTRLDKFVPTYDNNYLMKLGRYAIKGKIITKG